MRAKLLLFILAFGPLSCAAKEPVKPLDNALQERIEALKKKTLADMVFIEGGRFQMGDFGEIHAEERLPYTSQTENKPLHWVELDSFSLGSRKVTYEDFDVYTDANDLARIASAKFDKEYRDTPDMPAGVNWPEAKAYCRWLGRLTGLPIDLPTEAQWEFAARNRGQFVLWPTDNGKFERGRNVASSEQARQLVPSFTRSTLWAYPVGRFPPSPLGLYDMAGNSSDWVEDWFSGDYYASPNHKNPSGPKNGRMKVVRGIESEPETALAFYRQAREPVGKKRYLDPANKASLLSERSPAVSARCAVNSAERVGAGPR